VNVILMSMPDCVPQFPSGTWRAPSLACSMLAAHVEGHPVHIADLILKRSDVAGAVRGVIERYDPALVGLSAMSFQFATARRVASIIKSVRPATKIALGGYHATLMYEELARSEESKDLDFLVRGEGDKSFNEIVQAIDGQMDFADIKGLSYRRNGRFVHNEPRPLEDLDALRIPRRDCRIWRGYRFNFRKLDIIETSRGCTMRCNFCSMFRMYGRTFRTYRLERVIADIADAKRWGARYLALADDNITLDIDRLGRLCDAITQAGHNDVGYIIQASSAGIARDPALARKMATAGFKIVFLGIENVSERNLRLMKKTNTVDLTRRAIKYLHDNDILIVTSSTLTILTSTATRSSPRIPRPGCARNC